MGNSQTTVAAAGVDDIETSKENLCGCIPAIFGPINNPMLVAPPESETDEACDGDPQSATQNAFPRCPSPAETFQESLDSNSNREALNMEPSSSVKSQTAKPSTVENVVEKIDRTIEHSVAHAEKIEVSVPSAKSSEERETPDMIEIVHDANEAEAPAIAVVSSEEKTEENKLLEGLNTAHDLQAEVSAEVKKEPPVESVSDVVEASTLAAVSLEEKTEENKVLKGLNTAHSVQAEVSAEVKKDPPVEGASDVLEASTIAAISLEEKTEEKKDPKDGFIHGRHTCDSCLVTPIVGKRYHATNLPDHDLCEKCIHNYKGDEIKFQVVELERDRPLQERWRRHRARWA